MKLTANRLASFAVALWCLARIYQRHGADAVLPGLLGMGGLLSLIWFSTGYAQLLLQSRAARRALNCNVPPLAINLIGWILLLLFCVALVYAPARTA